MGCPFLPFSTFCHFLLYCELRHVPTTFLGFELQEYAWCPHGKGTEAQHTLGWMLRGQVAVNSTVVIEVCVEPLHPPAISSPPDLQRWAGFG